MDLTNLKKAGKLRLRRLGQGHGSGRGKTAGRGTKGQKARNSVPIFFEGGALPLTKRLPFLRGRGRNKIIKKHLIEVNIANLSKIPAKSVIDNDTLIKYGLLGARSKKTGAKLIGNSKIEVSYDVKIPATIGAKKSITAAGGSFS